jgi:RNA polymerase sigma-70 factor (ECF subfamily)
MPAEDEDLLQRARSGDAAALDELLAVHLPALRAYVRIHLPADLRARESCSDVVQSVCREALQRQDGFEYRGPEAFRGWLYCFARHKIRDRADYWRADRRAAAREHAAGADESLDQLAAAYRTLGSPSADAVQREHVLLLEQAFERLPEEYREVIGLCRIAGLSREEAGHRMGGRSPGAVRSLLNRALVSLSTELERLGVRE